MIEVKGLFKVQEIKEIGDKKLMKLTNSDKDKDGNYINTYYQIWCNDKVSKMTSNELKKKITKVLISINGWLKVDVSEINGKKYTNMTIFPTSIEEYKKGS
jgi:hypothetical protein